MDKKILHVGITIFILGCLLLSIIFFGNVKKSSVNASEDLMHHVFLPLASKNWESSHFDFNKGIALNDGTYLQSDMSDMGAGWYYTWTEFPNPNSQSSTFAEYVPMSYYGLYDTNLLSTDYDGWILFLNEPNNPAPYGSAIGSRLGAQRYADFVATYPNAKLVVGNVSVFATGWFINFWDELKTNYPDTPFPIYYGIHGYTEDWINLYWVSSWINGFPDFIYRSTGIYPKEIWITEFCETTGDTVAFQDLLDLWYSNSYVTRYAYFTNRYDPLQPWIPSTWHDFGLWENNSISPMGEVYRLNPNP